MQPTRSTLKPLENTQQYLLGTAQMFPIRVATGGEESGEDITEHLYHK